MGFIDNILDMIMTAVIIPTVPLLAKYAVKTFKKNIEVKVAEMENKTASKYISMITEVITQVVLNTTQTYVDSLKSQGKFDAEAQKVAFQMTKNKVLQLLAEDAINFLATTYGDVDLWLNTKIEQLVQENKIGISFSTQF